MTSSFTLVQDIAQGSSGLLVKIYRDRDGNKFAGKVINRSTYPDYKQEIKNLISVSGECNQVIKFVTTLEISKLDPSPIILMELCDCNLIQFVENKLPFVPLTKHNQPPRLSPKQYFSDVTKIKMAEQICRGVEFLHKKSTIHGGIHPKNILLKRVDGVTTVKLSSFGFSKVLPENTSGSFSADFEGLGFTAPECSDVSAKIRKSADIFSLGLVLFYFLSDGKHLFGQICDQQQNKINSEKKAKFFDLRNKPDTYCLTKEQAVCAVALIKKMICHKESERWKIEDVKHNPLFWSSEQKISFYETLHQHLKNEDNLSKVIHSLQKYRGDLLREGSNHYQDLKISPDQLPFNVNRLHKKTGATDCKHVQGLLRVIRNLAQHVTDKKTPIEVKKALGVRLDSSSYDPDIFITKLTEPYPQLLAHVYDVFRNRNIPGDFYPKLNCICNNLITISAEQSYLTRKPTIATRSEFIHSIVVTAPNHKVAVKLPNPPVDIPDEVKELARKYEIIEEDLFRCQLDVIYHGVERLSLNIDLKSPIRISGPDYASTSNDLECINLPESNRTEALNTILKDLKGGLILMRSSNGCALAAMRDSIVRIYFETKKLEQTLEVKFFSISNYLTSLSGSNFHNKIVFCIGSDPTDPRVPTPAIQVVVTPYIVTKVMAQQPVDEMSSSLVALSVERNH